MIDVLVPIQRWNFEELGQEVQAGCQTGDIRQGDTFNAREL